MEVFSNHTLAREGLCTIYNCPSLLTRRTSWKWPMARQQYPRGPLTRVELHDSGTNCHLSELLKHTPHPFPVFYFLLQWCGQ